MKQTLAYNSGQFREIVRREADSGQIEEMAKLPYAMRKQTRTLDHDARNQAGEILKRAVQVARDTSVESAN